MTLSSMPPRAVTLARAAGNFSREADADSAAVSDLRALAEGEGRADAACYVLGNSRKLPEQ